LFFEADGTIRKVIPTLRGIGVTKANREIQLDRYSAVSGKDISIAFIDTAHKFQGWKAVFAGAGAWLQYNSCDFGKDRLKTVILKGASPTGGTIQIRMNDINGPLLAEVLVPAGKDWQLIKKALIHFEPGIHHLVAVLKDHNEVAIDWIRFE
jgi:hypothetical protein